MRDPDGNEQLRRRVSGLESELEELRESEQFLSLSQRIASVGSWDWEFATNEVTWSEERFRIFGIRAEDSDGTTDAAARAFHPDDRERVEDQATLRALVTDKLRTQGFTVLEASNGEEALCVQPSKEPSSTPS